MVVPSQPASRAARGYSGRGLFPNRTFDWTEPPSAVVSRSRCAEPDVATGRGRLSGTAPMLSFSESGGSAGSGAENATVSGNATPGGAAGASSLGTSRRLGAGSAACSTDWLGAVGARAAADAGDSGASATRDTPSSLGRAGATLVESVNAPKAIPTRPWSPTDSATGRPNSWRSAAIHADSLMASTHARYAGPAHPSRPTPDTSCTSRAPAWRPAYGTRRTLPGYSRPRPSSASSGWSPHTPVRPR